MNPVVLYGVVAFLVGGYLISAAIRFRREQAAKRAEREGGTPPGRRIVAEPFPPAAATDGSRDTPPPGDPLPDTPPVDPAAPAVDPTPSEAGQPGRTGHPVPAVGPAASVLEVIRGIDWPGDLTPLTSVAPRPEARDRLTMVSPVPAEAVQAQMADALVAAGTTVECATEERATIQRDGLRGELQVFFRPLAARIADRDAFPTADANGTVVDLWVE